MDKKTITRIKYVITGVVAFIGIGIIAIVLFFFLVQKGAFGPLPGKSELKKIHNEEASLVYSSGGELIGKYFAQNRTNISRTKVPKHLIDALVATEDKRYFSHEGYDARSYLRVLFRTLLLQDRSGGGGSTLTQQLVKNLYGRSNFGFLSIPVSKVKEAIIASRLEKVYSKEELLMLYLNSVPFGEDVYGIESAAQRYFNKHTGELNIEEAAVLVGLLKANTYFNPRLYPHNSMQRRNIVLELMASENYLSHHMADSLKASPIKLNYENINIENPAGYFVYQVRKKAEAIIDSLNAGDELHFDLEKDGLRIHTSLNMQIQHMVTRASSEQMRGMQPLLDRELENLGAKEKWIQQLRRDSLITNADFELNEVELFDWDSIRSAKMSRVDSLWHYRKMLHAAVLITEPGTGRVLSWNGGNHFRYLPYDLVKARRQIASAFKPVLYASALENGFEPCSYLENEVKKYEDYDNWEPQNFDYSSTPDSTVALWYAMANSMNLPSVDLFFQNGYEKLVSTCNKMGLPPLIDDAPSVALGTLDVSLYEIVRAYGVFGDHGQFHDLHIIDKITDKNGNLVYQYEAREPFQALDSATCEQITAILQRAINEGTGTRIRTQFGIEADLAGKTGTAQSNSNAWFVAYTPKIAIGAWVGARSPEVHFTSNLGTGSTLALPIIGKVLQGIEAHLWLNDKYLANFEVSDSALIHFDCPPYQPKKKEGFLKRLFNPNKKEKEQDDKKKDGKGFRKFFRNLFNRD
jgi:penicillin-binding protein 1A